MTPGLPPPIPLGCGITLLVLLLVGAAFWLFVPLGVGCGIARVQVEVLVTDAATGTPVAGATVLVVPKWIVDQDPSFVQHAIDGKPEGEQEAAWLKSFVAPHATTGADGRCRAHSEAFRCHTARHIDRWLPSEPTAWNVADHLCVVARPGYATQTIPLGPQPMTEATDLDRYGSFELRMSLSVPLRPPESPRSR